MKYKQEDSERGITLISLVITIIILLILAGISIGTLTGDNGIITKAKEARLQTEFGQVREGMRLLASEYSIAKVSGEDNDFLTWLQNKNIINEDGEINIKELLGITMSTGNGSNRVETYTIELDTQIAKLASTDEILLASNKANNQAYNVKYYDEEGVPQIIDTLTLSSDNGEASYPEPSPLDIFEYSTTENDEIIIERIKYNASLDSMYSVIGGLKEIVVPKTIENKPVVEILKGAFYNLDITKVVIPNTVKKIKETTDGTYAGAFYLCKNLIEISFPEGASVAIPEDKWGAKNATITGINGEILAE